MTTLETRELPAIPSLNGIDDVATLQALAAIKTIIESRTIGPKEWLDANRLRGINGVLADILTNGGDGDSSSLNFATPPAPTNLFATGTFNNIYLGWDHIPYSNHAYTEVWRAQIDNLGDAVLIDTAWGNLYPDPVDDGVEHYYWIRFRSIAGVPGPFNSAAGTLGQTSLRPERILDALTGEISESHLLEALQNDIDALRNEIIIKVNENGYVAGIGIAVVDGDSGLPTGQVIVLADKFAIVTPNNDPNEAPTIPFIVGRVNGVTAVGVNGRLVVDGTIYGNAIVAKEITADHLFVGELSAITADMGDVTAGTFRTGTSGSRVEISDQGPFRIWMGSGTKTTDNANFYLDADGNAIFRGTLAAVDGVFTGTLDGVDGVFTGTVYAENIIGDVIDRLSYHEPGRLIKSSAVIDTFYTSDVVSIAKSNFSRNVKIEGVNFIIYIDPPSTTVFLEYTVSLTIKVYSGTTLVYN